MNADKEPVTVLLLEDAELDVILARRAVERALPHAVIAHAQDGADAWEFLTERRQLQGVSCRGKLALAVLDIRVPKVTGLELLARIRQDSHFHSTKAIVMSTSDDDRDISEAHRCGADAYLVKHIDASEFVRTLATLVKEHCRMSEFRKGLLFGVPSFA